MTSLLSSQLATPLLAVAAWAAGAIPTSSAYAQEVHLFARANNATGQMEVGTVELNGGAFYSGDPVDVTAQVGSLFSNVGSVEFVGNEVWLGLGFGLQRLTWPGLQSAGRLELGRVVGPIVPNATGATVFVSAPSEAVEYDFAGTELARKPHTVDIADAVASPAGFLVSTGDTFGQLFEVDSDIQVIREVGLGLPDMALQIPSALDYGSLARLSNGNFAVAGRAVGIIDSAGTALGVFNAGGFETDVLELEGGELFVPGLEAGLLDTTTGAVIRSVGAILAGTEIQAYSSESRDLGATSIVQRTCTTSPNSVGSGGRMFVLGSDDRDRDVLTVGATGLPPETFSLAIYGQTAFAGAFGSGTLCISPFAPGIQRTAVQPADSTGASTTVFFRDSLGGFGDPIMAGSTWIFQVIYRDAVGGVAVMNATDSVTATFAN